MNIRPTGARIVVQIQKQEKSEGGIELISDTIQGPQKAIVLAVGPGALLETGERAPVCVNVGDMIMVQPHLGIPVTEDEVDYLIINDREVVCVVREVN